MTARAAVTAAARRALPPGTDGVLVRAPGRVNLLGEHTDYNGLPALPMAIDRAVYVAGWRLAARCVEAANLDPRRGARRFALDAPCAPGPAGDWGNYVQAAVRAVAGELAEGGLGLAVGADLPAGAGLSSSSALVVGVALALLAVGGRPVDRLALAERLAQGERWVGTLSGGMDQATILLAEPGRALHVDFYPLRARPIPLPAGHAVVVCHSLVSAEKSAGARAAYNHRVVECRLATHVLAHALGVELARLGCLRTAVPGRTLAEHAALLGTLLPDAPLDLAAIARAIGVAPGALAPLLRDDAGGVLAGGDETFRPVARARHVLTEAERVEAAARACHAGDAAALGALMDASHRSCRDDYAISHPALEALVAIARTAGAAGARLTGAGFGGCTVSLVPRAAVGALLDRVDREFYRPRLAAGGDPARHRFVLAPAAGAEVAALTPADAPG